MGANISSKLQDALNNVEMTYDQLRDIADNMVREYSANLDKLVAQVSNIENLSNDALREIGLKIVLESYSFSEVVEKAGFKAKAAELLRKEKYSNIFNKEEGAIAARDNQTLVQISEEFVAEALYDLVANLFKNKRTEIRYIVDMFKVAITTRSSETRLTMN